MGTTHTFCRLFFANARSPLSTFATARKHRWPVALRVSGIHRNRDSARARARHSAQPSLGAQPVRNAKRLVPSGLSLLMRSPARHRGPARWRWRARASASARRARRGTWAAAGAACGRGAERVGANRHTFCCTEHVAGEILGACFKSTIEQGNGKKRARRTRGSGGLTGHGLVGLGVGLVGSVRTWPCAPTTRLGHPHCSCGTGACSVQLYTRSVTARTERASSL